MNDRIEALHDTYRGHLEEIRRRTPEEVSGRLADFLREAAPRIAEDFLAALLELQGAGEYLEEETSRARIRDGITHWLRDLIPPLDGDRLEAHLERQISLGRLHARIDLPLHLLNTGVRILKQQVHLELMARARDIRDYYRLETAIDMMIDVTASMMGECYFTDLVEEDKQIKSLQFHLSGQELALRCERLKALAFAWQARLLGLLLHEPAPSSRLLPNITHSDVGLWLRHKAPILFPQSEQLADIATQLERIDELVAELRQGRERQQAQALNRTVEQLSDRVLALTAMLDLLSDHALTLDNARDPLTRLLTRRYLEPILQRETQFARRHQRTYVLMLADLDHFKRINDELGHRAGDEVLAEVAERLATTLREGDFVFRYGGEEFLLLLPDLDLGSAGEVAGKLLDAMRRRPVELVEGGPLSVTMSIGVARYDGHPDYHRTIERADQALYQAKQQGRDRYCLAPD